MKSFIVLGLGRFGISFAKTVIELGHEVLGADADEEIVRRHANDLTHIVEADITSEDFLKSIEISKFDAVIVAVSSSLQVSIMATLVAKEVGAKYILAKAQNDFHSKLLYKIGADVVILPEKDIGIKAAHSLLTKSFLNSVEISENHSVMSLHPPKQWIGKSLNEIKEKLPQEVHLLAIKSGKDKLIMLPGNDEEISDGDIITVMGDNVALQRLEGKR
ncbi:MAG: TrkA family potassium uptake protein [Clostridia bacterium]|nr:TrkA family potassium uptake protein [Clostridia bacterium]